jgi:hypothetical protein
MILHLFFVFGFTLHYSLFTVYLATMSVTQVIQRRKAGCLTNDESENMLKEAAVAYLTILS